MQLSLTHYISGLPGNILAFFSSLPGVSAIPSSDAAQPPLSPLAQGAAASPQSPLGPLGPVGPLEEPARSLSAQLSSQLVLAQAGGESPLFGREVFWASDFGAGPTLV